LTNNELFSKALSQGYTAVLFARLWAVVCPDMTNMSSVRGKI
jgi:hypothetical protein